VPPLHARARGRPVLTAVLERVLDRGDEGAVHALELFEAVRPRGVCGGWLNPAGDTGAARVAAGDGSCPLWRRRGGSEAAVRAGAGEGVEIRTEVIVRGGARAGAGMVIGVVLETPDRVEAVMMLLLGAALAITVAVIDLLGTGVGTMLVPDRIGTGMMPEISPGQRDRRPRSLAVAGEHADQAPAHGLRIRRCRCSLAAKPVGGGMDCRHARTGAKEGRSRANLSTSWPRPWSGLFLRVLAAPRACLWVSQAAGSCFRGAPRERPCLFGGYRDRASRSAGQRG
jgi:hypothetical protein